MSFVKVKKLRDFDWDFPRYESAGAAGMDLRACVEEGKLTLKPFERLLVATGLALEIPQGYEMQIRPRSGLALKHGITIANAPGTIDSDYRGELCVILVNLGDSVYDVCHGARIAQMVLAPVSRCEWIEVDGLEASIRGSNGFGSTGK